MCRFLTAHHHKYRCYTRVDTELPPLAESAMGISSSPASTAHSMDLDWNPLLRQGVNQHPGDVSVAVINTGELYEGSIDFSSGQMMVRVDGLPEFASF